MIKADLIIVGGGVAGLASGFFIKNCNTIILEKNNKPGKKLLMSGSGQCNITNVTPINEFKLKYGGKERFVEPCLYEFSNKSLINLLESNNIKLFVDKNGKVFPSSKNSRDILNLFLNLCEINNTKILYNQKVISIKQSNEKFILKTESNEYETKFLIISTGGLSYPTSGSTGDGFKFCSELGHNIVQPKPALTSVITKQNFSELEGIALKNITTTIVNKSITYIGDIVFTRNGLSGPAILNISRFLNKIDSISLKLIDISYQEFTNSLILFSKINPKAEIKSFLKTYSIPERLIDFLLKELSINGVKISEFSKSNRKKLYDLLHNFKLDIEDISGFNQAMVTAGGVDIKEIDRKTMESKIIKNLFFAGEVIDIDGDTGGYNIQFAISSAYLATKKISCNIL